MCAGITSAATAFVPIGESDVRGWRETENMEKDRDRHREEGGEMDRESKPQRERGSEGMEHLWCLGPLLCKEVTWWKWVWSSPHHHCQWSLVEFVLLSHDLRLCWIRGPGSQGRHPAGVLLEAMTAFCSFEASHAGGRASKERVSAGVTGPGDQEELGCCSTVGGRKECVWNPGEPLGCLSGLPVPSDDYKGANCTTTTWKCSEPLERKVQAIPPG